ncbi:hypothetical protein [Pseudoxanthomonas wuyuanensis]
MKTKLLLPSILVTSLLAATLPAAAQDASTGGSVETTAEAFAEASAPTEQLATRYADLMGSTEAATGLIQQLRSNAEDGAAMGYGEIDNALALTREMIESGAATDVDGALDTVLQLHSEGMGWGQVAQELGVNLGDAVSATRGVGAAAQVGGNADAALSLAGQTGVGTATAGSAGADTAASAGIRADVGRDAGARLDTRVDTRIDAGLRGSVPGRPAGLSAPQLPQRVPLLGSPGRP